MIENIGFYTLSDQRARDASLSSPMIRTEIILTNRCNFHCPYCRGLNGEANKTLPINDVLRTIYLWAKDGLINIRFSGGEPLLYKNLIDVIQYCKQNGVIRIAVSSNGSLPTKKYDELLKAGVNDFSISLDACCAADGDQMTGGVFGSWNKVVNNIKYLAECVYTTVGIVLTDKNAEQAIDTILFAHELGVSDIRVIPAAQYMRENTKDLEQIPQSVLNEHPILKYRVTRAMLGHSVRGISKSDTNRCYLVQDDSVMAGGYHYPCVIYMREGGKPIGAVSATMRTDRGEWMTKHDTHKDSICRNNCLDVCIDYNNRLHEFHLETC